MGKEAASPGSELFLEDSVCTTWHLLQGLKTFVFPRRVGVLRELPGCSLLPAFRAAILCFSWTSSKLSGDVPCQIISTEETEDCVFTVRS